MIDFTYYAPTEVVFGKNTQQRVGEMLRKYGAKKVLVHYGGQSAIKSGLLDIVIESIEKEGIEYFKLGGVVPNPRLSKVYEGIDLCRKEGVDFLLAVGGGSVIDSCKAISLGVHYDGDVWDFYAKQMEPTTKVLSVATVLTLPAAGSEMSDSSVITNDNTKQKIGFSTNQYRPKFAIMNPELTFTLPSHQTSCGVVDIMMHTMERYFSFENDMTLTDNIAESILRTVKEMSFRVLRNPMDYHARAQIMWASSLAHNDLTGCGTLGDWATHQIEHELSALYDVSHGAGLAVVWPSWARNVYKLCPSRFARFAVNVLNVPNDFLSDEALALEGIAAMERFYKAINMPISIPELIGRKATEEEIQYMASLCTSDGANTVGNFKKLSKEDIISIYTEANK